MRCVRGWQTNQANQAFVYWEALSNSRHREPNFWTKGFSSPAFCTVAFSSSPFLPFGCFPLLLSINHHHHSCSWQKLFCLPPFLFLPQWKCAKRLRRSCGPEKEGGGGCAVTPLASHFIKSITPLSPPQPLTTHLSPSLCASPTMY